MRICIFVNNATKHVGKYSDMEIPSNSPTYDTKWYLSNPGWKRHHELRKTTLDITSSISRLG